MQCIFVVSNGLFYLLPGEYDWRMDGWDGFGRHPPEIARWPAAFKGRGKAVRCISHHTASHIDPIRFTIDSGCTGVKADIWLHNNDILVGSSVPALSAQNTLQDVYLNPLVRTLKKRNAAAASKGGENNPPKGIFEHDASQPFIVLLLDFRSSADTLWPRLVSQLDSLRERGYLTHFRGSEIVQRPVTVVVTGRVPFELIRENRNYRDIFFDAALDELALNDIDNLSEVFRALPPPRRDVPTGNSHASEEPGTSRNQTASQPAVRETAKRPPTAYRYNLHNSYCASTDFKESIGLPHRGRFSRQQIELIRAQVQAAHRRGLKAKYHGIPGWHGKLRDLIWHTLAEEGADLIEVDWFGHRPRERGWRRRLVAEGDGERAFNGQFMEILSSRKG